MRGYYVSGGPPGLWDLLSLVVLAMLLALGTALLSGCRTQRSGIVERVRVDTAYITKERRDSVWMKDSVYVREKVTGDTVWMEVTRWNRVVKNVTRIDTVYRARVDSVPVIVEVTKEVEKRLTAWQRGRMMAGDILVIGLVIAFFVWVKKFLP